MTWSDAKTWAASLGVGGFHDWRLPYASVIARAGPALAPMVYNCTGGGGLFGLDEVRCRDNEMGYMYYYNLPGSPGSNKTGTQTAVGGQMLTHIQRGYWSGTEFDSGLAWLFGFDHGLQSPVGEGDPLAAWAVRPGDVRAAAPEPASLLLIGVGMFGLGWSRRRGRRGA
jgi:hypothetical protein